MNQRLRQFKLFCALSTLLMGLCTLIGWAADIPALRSVHGSLSPMNPLTAVCFLLCSALLVLLVRPLSPTTLRWRAGLAGLLVLLAGARLVAMMGWDLLLDRQLFTTLLGNNRMAPNTALCFVLIGLSVLSLPRPSRGAWNLTQTLAVLSCSIVMVALCGYLYKTAAISGVMAHTPMALNTAVGLLMTSLGLLVHQRNQGFISLLFRQDLGGRMLRQMLPAVILIPLLLGWARLRGELLEYYSTELGVALFTISTIAVLGILTWICGLSMSRIDQDFQNQKQILSSVLDTIGDGVSVQDMTGQTLVFNPAAIQIIGLDRRNTGVASYPTGFGSFFPDEKTILPLDQQPMQRALRGLETNHGELFFRSPEKPQGIHLSCTGRPLVASDGTIQGGVVIFRDISQQKHIEKNLRETNEELEKRITTRVSQLKKSEAQVQQLQKMDAIGRLAGGVAHDFNNTLNVILLHCETLMDSETPREKFAEGLSQIKEATQRGANLTRQLLVFSRQQQVTLQKVDLSKVIQDLLQMLKRLIPESIHIETRLNTKLRPIMGDVSQLEQVIMNLVINARDAITGSGTISIETANVELTEDFVGTHLRTSAGSYIMVSITDSGCGMDEATKRRIFEPFFTTKGTGKGTGLGLSTAYGIIENHKGSIWVYSEPGRGSVFRIYFPVGATEIASQAMPVLAAPKDLRGRETVLLVEDEPILRQLFTEALQKFGYHVLVAQHGPHALELMKADGPHIQLLLTDVIMPEMTGPELARQAHALQPKLRILFMSGYVEDQFATGPHMPPLLNEQTAMIQKPFDSASLAAQIRELLGRSDKI